MSDFYNKKFYDLNEYIYGIETQIEIVREEFYYNYSKECEEELNWLYDELKVAINQLFEKKESKYEC